MATIEISLPPSLHEFVSQQLEESNCQSPDDYIAFLLEQERRRMALKNLENEALIGLDSGPAEEVTEDKKEELRRRVHEQIANGSAS